jgi:hypothetical protein
MSLGLRRGVTLLAIYAVALRVILLAFLPLGPSVAAAAAVDPFSVICHSSAGGADQTGPVKPHLIPGHACEHCNLCGTVAPPSAPDAAFHALPIPTSIVQILRPASAVARSSVSFAPKLARGPPAFA